MKRILFVDDEVNILEGLQRMLRPQRGEWDMSFAPGAQAALTMLESSPFDVVVSDMRMPGMDGAALLNIVREKYPAALRFVLSGYTELQASFRAVPVAHQFLVKPCDPDQLRTAIQRATSLSEVLNSKMLAGLVGSLQDLPSLPKTYGELRRALSDPEIGVDDVVKIVERDVAISAKILQLVNSAFFGITRDVTQIKTAVSYLGLNILQNLVLSAEVFRVFQPKKPIPGFSVEEFHLHSQYAARIAGKIPLKYEMNGGAMAAALLHDVGKLVIAERSPDHFARALSGAQEDHRPLYAIEEELIGVSHADVGAYLLSLWGLPFPVVEAVAHHHHPERVPHDKINMITLVYAANILAHEHAPKVPETSEMVFDTIQPDFLGGEGTEENLAEWHKIAEEATHEPQPATRGR
ncbi:MAG TPA: response regulator [Candidatus Acidoferrales bacterium]|nr:response regulator [Candidatus Acidoferrales bacterium]